MTVGEEPLTLKCGIVEFLSTDLIWFIILEIQVVAVDKGQLVFFAKAIAKSLQNRKQPSFW